MCNEIDNLQLHDDFFSFLLDISEKYSKCDAIRFEKDEVEIKVTYASMYHKILSLMKNLKEKYENVHHIALVGPFNYEWIMTFFAVTSLGKVLVPLDMNLSPNDVRQLIVESDTSLVCFTTKPNEQLTQLIREESIPILESETIDQYCDSYRTIDKTNFQKPGKEQLAVICYTSGTTGESKGVMLSQQNIVYNVAATVIGTGCNDFNKGCYVPVLPPHHMFQITTGLLVPLSRGMTLCLMNSLKDLSKALMKYKPQIIFLVPAIAENLYKQLKYRVRKGKTAEYFNRLKEFSQQLLREGIDARYELFYSMRDIFGYNLERIMCGGATLDTSIVSLFADVGITVLNGYGITEASPVLTCNRMNNLDNSTVGEPIPLADIKIVDGEICSRGPMIFKGYYKRPDLTKEVFINEWFKTGDLGEIDGNGNIVIKGRKKNLIILRDGNNISPEELEKKLLNIDGVSDGIVFARTGNGTEVLTFLVYQETLEGETDEQILYKQEAIRNSVEEINKQWPFYKQIKCVEFTKQNFEKTALGKNKRFLIK